MIKRRTNLFTICYSLVLAIGASPALANSLPEERTPLASDFDLSRRAPSNESVRHRLQREGESRRFRKDKLGPYLTYSPVSGGPTLEFGALGAGRKGTPGLAHVGVDWSF